MLISHLIRILNVFTCNRKYLELKLGDKFKNKHCDKENRQLKSQKTQTSSFSILLILFYKILKEKLILSQSFYPIFRLILSKFLHYPDTFVCLYFF